MSDPHMDFDYTVGAANTCDSYICCRPEFGFPTAKEYQAGPFGSYLCDIPEWTLQTMFDHIRDVTKPDALFWTGDNSAHNVWSNTDIEVTNYTLHIT